MAAAPLWAGIDLTTAPQWALDILMNGEAIAVTKTRRQDGYTGAPRLAAAGAGEGAAGSAAADVGHGHGAAQRELRHVGMEPH